MSNMDYSGFGNSLAGAVRHGRALNEASQHKGILGVIAGAIGGFVASGFNPVGLAVGGAAALLQDYAPDEVKPYIPIATAYFGKKLGVGANAGAGQTMSDPYSGQDTNTNSEMY